MKQQVKGDFYFLTFGFVHDVLSSCIILINNLSVFAFICSSMG